MKNTNQHTYAKTRRLRGGSRIPTANQDRIRKTQITKQIIHCLSQLKRFSPCFQSGNTLRMVQFGYNLGRLQELCGETTHPEIWWTPIETAIKDSNWDDLNVYIDDLQKALQVDYDTSVVDKGC